MKEVVRMGEGIERAKEKGEGRQTEIGGGE
jgi:hypothetical protein